MEPTDTILDFEMYGDFDQDSKQLIASQSESAPPDIVAQAISATLRDNIDDISVNDNDSVTFYNNDDSSSIVYAVKNRKRKQIDAYIDEESVALTEIEPLTFGENSPIKKVRRHKINTNLHTNEIPGPSRPAPLYAQDPNQYKHDKVKCTKIKRAQNSKLHHDRVKQKPMYYKKMYETEKAARELLEHEKAALTARVTTLEEIIEQKRQEDLKCKEVIDWLLEN